MTLTEAPVVRPVRPRPLPIVVLRILLPTFAAVVALAVVVTATFSSLHGAAGPAPATRPIELVGPRMIGEDSKKRPFVITATTAEREEGSNRIRLNSLRSELRCFSLRSSFSLEARNCSAIWSTVIDDDPRRRMYSATTAVMETP